MLEDARRILYLQARNLGDSVMGTGLVEAIGRTWPNIAITVLTRPQFADTYRSNPYVASMQFASFPMGTTKYFGVRPALELAVQVARQHASRFDAVVHFSGDFRENFLGWLISPRGNIGVTWPEGHLFRSQVRVGLQFLLAKRVPVAEVNLYAALASFAKGLGAVAPALPRLYDRSGRMLEHRSGGDTIGLHPGASQESKLWPRECWRALLDFLVASGFKVALFGAPSERGQLEAIAPAGDLRVRIVTHPLPDFYEAVASLRALVCLDSFSVHAAKAMGTPAVMINGANIAAVFAPPGVALIDGGARLPCAPCMNKPTCKESASAYACIRSITVNEVIEALRSLGVLSA